MCISGGTHECRQFRTRAIRQTCRDAKHAEPQKLDFGSIKCCFRCREFNGHSDITKISEYCSLVTFSLPFLIEMCWRYLVLTLLREQLPEPEQRYPANRDRTPAKQNTPRAPNSRSNLPTQPRREAASVQRVRTPSSLS